MSDVSSAIRGGGVAGGHKLFTLREIKIIRTIVAYYEAHLFNSDGNPIIVSRVLFLPRLFRRIHEAFHFLPLNWSLEMHPTSSLFRCRCRPVPAVVPPCSSLSRPHCCPHPRCPCSRWRLHCLHVVAAVACDIRSRNGR